MTTTHFSHSLNGSLDTAVASTSLNALASGAYGAGGGDQQHPHGWHHHRLRHGRSDHYVVVSRHRRSGSAHHHRVDFARGRCRELPDAAGGTAAAAPIYLSTVFPMVASVSTSTIVCPNIPIPPYNFKVQIQNNLGVTLPATNTSTCKLQRRTLANW